LAGWKRLASLIVFHDRAVVGERVCNGFKLKLIVSYLVGGRDGGWAKDFIDLNVRHFHEKLRELLPPQCCFRQRIFPALCSPWQVRPWGIAACTHFLGYRNLYALGLVHGILGLCMAISVPDVATHHMMVGLGYLQYHH